jgi:hypothetical protein
MAGFDNMQGAALTSDVPAAKGAAMTRTPLLLALAATAALAGCNKESHTIVAGGPQDDTNVSSENLANVQLPPSITASKIYRCKDNSVIYVDWLSNGAARVRSKQTDVGETVQVGSGQPLQGSADAKSITYKGQPCSV